METNDLRIANIRLDEVNDLLIDPDNPLIADVLKLIEHYGGIDEIRRFGRPVRGKDATALDACGIRRGCRELPMPAIDTDHLCSGALAEIGLCRVRGTHNRRGVSPTTDVYGAIRAVQQACPLQGARIGRILQLRKREIDIVQIDREYAKTHHG